MNEIPNNMAVEEEIAFCNDCWFEVQKAVNKRKKEL